LRNASKSIADPGSGTHHGCLDNLCAGIRVGRSGRFNRNERTQVYAEYGVSYPQPLGAYEVDHFIPLEIGGSNDIKNLWLEPATPTPGFHQKDQFEDFEHAQVCNGTISAPEAQSRIISDWYWYWQEEVEGTTATTSAPVQFASTPAPQSSTATEASPAYYTSSYRTAKYWHPASRSGCSRCRATLYASLAGWVV
jgi:hypothetical protein